MLNWKSSLLLVALLCMGALLVGKASADSPGTGPAQYRLLRWEDMVPQGWDPTRRFRDMPGLALLSDSNPKARALLAEMRQAWDNAPTLYSLDGVDVKLSGYLVPLEQGRDGLTEFLLVPYFGACIHTPPPPANQIVHVRLVSPVKGLRAMDAVWVSGRMTVQRRASELGVSGYAMQAMRVDPYLMALVR